MAVGFRFNLWGYFSNLPKENWHGPWSLFLQGAVSILNSPKCQLSCSYPENRRLIGPCRLCLGVPHQSLPQAGAERHLPAEIQYTRNVDTMSCWDLVTHFLGVKCPILLCKISFKINSVFVAYMPLIQENMSVILFFFLKLTCPVNSNSGLSSSRPAVIVFLVLSLYAIETQIGRRNLAKRRMKRGFLLIPVQKCLLAFRQQVWPEIPPLFVLPIKIFDFKL